MEIKHLERGHFQNGIYAAMYEPACKDLDLCNMIFLFFTQFLHNEHKYGGAVSQHIAVILNNWP